MEVRAIRIDERPLVSWKRVVFRKAPVGACMFRLRERERRQDIISHA